MEEVRWKELSDVEVGRPNYLAYGITHNGRWNLHGSCKFVLGVQKVNEVSPLIYTPSMS